MQQFLYRKKYRAMAAVFLLIGIGMVLVAAFLEPPATARPVYWALVSWGCAIALLAFSVLFFTNSLHSCEIAPDKLLVTTGNRTAAYPFAGGEFVLDYTLVKTTFWRSFTLSYRTLRITADGRETTLHMEAPQEEFDAFAQKLAQAASAAGGKVEVKGQ